jgi:hypothetical protein
MRTLLVLAAVAALAVAATTDTLRNRLTHASAPPAPLAVKARARIVPPGVDGGFMGALFYSDPTDRCRLRAVGLPGFARVSPPKYRGCQFSLSPDGRTALPAAAVWRPQGGLAAVPAGESFELTSPASSHTLSVSGRAPAFKPDGTLTYVRGGAVVEWTSRCGPGDGLFTLPGDNATARCSKVLFRGPAAELVWLTNSRFVVATPGHIEIREGSALVSRRSLPRARRVRLEPSPRGTFFTAWVNERLAAGYDERGNEIVLPPLPDVRSLAWAPSERWGAAATRRGSVYVFRTNAGDARLRRLDFRADDLAWR